jgi:hypothetical protein
MFEFFTGFFTNIFNILILLIGVAVGVLVGIVVVRYGIGHRNQVLYCRERDGRGFELPIEKEDALSLQTEDPDLRFYKYGRSYEFLGKLGRSFTRFFGKEGTAYTWKLEGFDKDANKKMVEFDTLEEAVKFRWGPKFYEAVPKKQKQLLRDDKVLLTVNLEEGVTPKGYEPVTEETITLKADEDMAGVLATGLQGLTKTSISQWIFILGAGVGAGWILNTLLM